MPTRRRRCQPRSRKTLLDYPQLFRRRPSTAATRVNNFKATDVASVSKVIHTDNQLQAGQFGKAAYTGWIRLLELMTALLWAVVHLLHGQSISKSRSKFSARSMSDEALDLLAQLAKGA